MPRGGGGRIAAILMGLGVSFRSLARFLFRRLLQAILVLLAVTVLVFLLIYLTGDPVRAMLPLDASNQDVINIRHQLGLDQPLWRQYVIFLQQAAEGNLGDSFKFHQPAMGLVLQRLPATAILAVASIILACAVSFPLGILAARHRNSIWDHIATFISMLSVSTPSFWLGIILILVFAGQLQWLPASGMGGFSHLILPAVTLSSYSIGLLTRLIRGALLEVLSQPFLATARAKGLSEAVVMVRHALRNALVPIVTIVGLQLGALLGGSVIVETVFAWPGVGWLLIQAISARDLPLVRADVLAVALLFVVINLATDVAYSFIDPRIRVA